MLILLVFFILRIKNRFNFLLNREILCDKILENIGGQKWVQTIGQNEKKIIN